MPTDDTELSVNPADDLSYELQEVALNRITLPIHSPT